MLPGQSLPPHRGLSCTRVRLYPGTTWLVRSVSPSHVVEASDRRRPPLSQHSILTPDVKPSTAHINIGISAFK
ncbi:hypothetical protein TIFTF001_021064 [Ficus carica]|uniref:Uncharacterized protein n=1 Tax=Ficus carica TaxID=3494 RepID=A0AA88ABY0_FICCA|nr:hypothetical protein TIFTF001_021064 [Ficus carica]